MGEDDATSWKVRLAQNYVAQKGQLIVLQYSDFWQS